MSQLLILALRNFEEDQGWYLGNDNKSDETDKTFLRRSQKFKEEKSSYSSVDNS